MKMRHYDGYETCIHSMKRKDAPWRVHSSCESPLKLFTGKHYELPYSTACVKCRFYRNEEQNNDFSQFKK